jgi:O-antigen ligase
MTSSAIWKISFGLLAMVAIFLMATGAKRTIAIGAVLVFIPFQFVQTQYASSSELIAYALAVVLLISGNLRLRMLPALGLIVLSYLASLALADRALLLKHAVFMFQFFSVVAIFILAYNFSRSVQSERSIIAVLLATNVLVIGYCGLQLLAGPGERFMPFGIEEFKFNVNRNPGDPRLVGPFSSPGSTAGYFTLMVLVCAVELMYARGGRRLLVHALIGFNLLGLVATGNRTGFLILVVMFPAFLFLFRKALGARTITRYLVGGSVALIVASSIAIAFTDFGRMFERLANVTETEAGVPTTRAETWPVAIEKIKRAPWFGEGPHFWTAEDAEIEGRKQLQVEFEETGEVVSVVDPYPHSLYLYLLRTVGIVGLVAVVWFFVRVWLLLRRQLKAPDLPPSAAAIARLGLLIVPAFLIAQITLEFNRPTTVDYAQFIFGLMGLLLGAGDRVEAVNARNPEAAPGPEPVRRAEQALRPSAAGLRGRIEGR